LLKKFVLAAAALLLALAFFAGQRMGAPLSASSAGPASSRDEAAQALSGKTVLDAVFASAPPLPAAPTTALSTALASQLPDDMPVNEVIEVLDTQARAGDAEAASRIGAELQRCRQLKTAAPTGSSGATLSNWRDGRSTATRSKGKRRPWTAYSNGARAWNRTAARLIPSDRVTPSATTLRQAYAAMRDRPSKSWVVA